MYVSHLLFDHPIELNILRRAVMAGFEDAADVTIVTETHGGDFPYLMRIVQPAVETEPTLEQMLNVARLLQVIFLTDDVAVGELYDDGFSLISPDGTTAVVRADEEGLDGGDLILLPESRELYRSIESRLTHAIAD